jgi:hypothetical protein
MQQLDSGINGQADKPRVFGAWLLLTLAAIWLIPNTISLIVDFSRGTQPNSLDYFRNYKTGISGLWRAYQSNVYLACMMTVLLVPFLIEKGTLAKSVLRRVFTRAETPLILLAFLPEIALIAQSIYFHKGIAKAFTGGNMLEMLRYSTHSLAGILNWLNRYGQLFIEGLALAWLKILLIGSSDRRKSLYLFGGFEVASLLLKFSRAWHSYLVSQANGLSRYETGSFSPGLIFWNILEVGVAIWIAWMLTEAFRPKLNAVAILFIMPIITNYFFSNGGGWTFRAATGIPAIIIWAILSRSKLKVTPWYLPPPNDEDSLQT